MNSSGAGAQAVFVVVRRPLFRAAVVRVLGADGRFVVVGSAADAQAAADVLERCAAALVLLEPPAEAARLGKHVALVAEELRCVIVFTARADIDEAYALASGANGLLSKTIEPRELPAAILNIYGRVAARVPELR